MLHRGFKSVNGKACKEATEGPEKREQWLDKGGGAEAESSQQVRGAPGGRAPTAHEDGLHVKDEGNWKDKDDFGLLAPVAGYVASHAPRWGI